MRVSFVCLFSSLALSSVRMVGLFVWTGIEMGGNGGSKGHKTVFVRILSYLRGRMGGCNRKRATARFGQQAVSFLLFSSQEWVYVLVFKGIVFSNGRFYVKKRPF